MHSLFLDGKRAFNMFKNIFIRVIPDLGPARPDGAAEAQQIG